MDQDYISQSLEQEQNNKVFDDIDSWTTFTRDNFGEFFGVLFLNIRSIKKHFDEFLCYIENSISNLNVLILAEVNISEWEFEMNRGLFFLNDYGCVEKLRTNRAGGGLMVYYKNTANRILTIRVNLEKDLINYLQKLRLTLLLMWMTYMTI